MHCVGMKFLEFITLLNVSIQYLKVEEPYCAVVTFVIVYFVLFIAIILE